MRPAITKTLLGFGAILLLPVSWIGSEVRYARRISPNKVPTAGTFFQRFGAPRYVFEVRNRGTLYYEFSGFSRPPSRLLALPSSEPAYFYDQEGKLAGWCYDPGDQPTCREAWQRTSDSPIDIIIIRQRFSQ